MRSVERRRSCFAFRAETRSDWICADKVTGYSLQVTGYRSGGAAPGRTDGFNLDSEGGTRGGVTFQGGDFAHPACDFKFSERFGIVVGEAGAEDLGNFVGVVPAQHVRHDSHQGAELAGGFHHAGGSAINFFRGGKATEAEAEGALGLVFAQPNGQQYM